VELLDLVATVEELAGLAPDYTHFSQSLLPLISVKQSAIETLFSVKAAVSKAKPKQWNCPVRKAKPISTGLGCICNNKTLAPNTQKPP
jgi:hypothetical protein